MLCPLCQTKLEVWTYRTDTDYACIWNDKCINADMPRYIAKTPYLDLPWHDKDKVLKKIKLYLVFS
jgi:hypothetical protein